MLGLTTVFFGVWISGRRMCQAPTSVFALLCLPTQLILSVFFALSLGSIQSQAENFDETLFTSEFPRVFDGAHSLAIFAGGFVLGHGDLLCATAAAHIPTSVTFPIYVGWALVQGSLLNFFIEDSTARLAPFLAGLCLALLAILSMAASQMAQRRVSPADGPRSSPVGTTQLSQGPLERAESASERGEPALGTCGTSAEPLKAAFGASSALGEITSERRVSQKYTLLSVLAGVCAGLWSPLSTYGRGRDPEEGEVELPEGLRNPYSTLVVFMVGQTAALPLVLWEIELIERGVAATPSPLRVLGAACRRLQVLPRADRVWGVVTGFFLASGYLFYFLGTEVCGVFLSPGNGVVLGVWVGKDWEPGGGGGDRLRMPWPGGLGSYLFFSYTFLDLLPF